MPSHSASTFLLVLLGVVLASGHPLQFISRELERRVNSIAAELELTKPEIGSNPLFDAVVITSGQRRDDLRLMNATLNVYLHIFSSILDQEGTPSSLVSHQKVKEVVLYLQKQMVDLQNHLNHASHHREDLFDRLDRIKVDDPLVQRKALAEVKQVYQAVSVVIRPNH